MDNESQETPMSDDSHISDITTQWTIFNDALKGDATIAQNARQKVIERYSGAVRRYAVVVLRDQNLADDVLQDFAMKVLCGDFRHATPTKGRFRDYLKTSLRRLIRSYLAAQAGLPISFPESYDGPSIEDDPMAEQEEQDRFFWRKEFVNRAWARLEAQERHKGRDLPFDVLLKYRYKEKPSAAEVAAYFSEKLGRPISVMKIRGARHEARVFLKKALLDEVARTLRVPSRENVHEELIDLGLHRWLDDQLKNRVHGTSNN